MTARDRATLKSYFQTGDQPTETQFGDLLDSMRLGGADVSAETLIAWTAGSAYQMTSITYHATYTRAISSGPVVWPDGTAGWFTSDTINATWQTVDAYHVTHAVSGLTVRQTAVTRNANGDVTVKPALTVS